MLALCKQSTFEHFKEIKIESITITED